MKRILVLLLLFFAGVVRATNPTVAAAAVHVGSGTTNTTGTVSATGNMQLVISFQATSSAFYPISVTDTLGDTYASFFGTINNVNSTKVNGGYRMSAFYAYNMSTGSNAATVNYSGTSSSNIVYYADCANIAAASALLSNIYAQQAALASGTNAITVAGGTGTDNITAQPALVVTAIQGSNGTVTAGTNPISLTIAASGGNPTKLEYGVATSTYASFDSTATLTGGTTPTYYSWQLVLLGNAAPPPPSNGSQFFLQ